MNYYHCLDQAQGLGGETKFIQKTSALKELGANAWAARVMMAVTIIWKKKNAYPSVGDFLSSLQQPGEVSSQPHFTAENPKAGPVP